MVIGILTLLIGMLLPTLAATRRAADRTACASRVRDLVAASHFHLVNNRRFPAPLYMPAAGGVMPASIQPRLLAELAAALRYPDPTPATTLDQLPPAFLCPVRRKLDFNTAIDSSLGTPIWQTGYMYVGGLEQKPNGGTILLPDRHANIRGSRRGVLWADTLTVAAYGPTILGYGYFHTVGAVDFDPTYKVSRTRSGLDGQHLGWSDGSVEWVPGRRILFDPANPDAHTSYKVTIGPAYTVRYLY